MVRSKRAINATAEETITPPATLDEHHVVAKVARGEGNNLWSVALPTGESVLAELPARFRSIFWLKRGGFVIVNASAFEDRQNKLKGEIVNIVRDEKAWRKQPYWPPEFGKASAARLDADDDSPPVGEMPPSDDSDHELVQQ